MRVGTEASGAQDRAGSARPLFVCACYHCGLVVPERGRFSATVLGAEREFCCAGCEAVACTIVAGGFESYYETRETPQADQARTSLPPELTASDVYDDAAAQSQFVSSPTANEREVTLILDRIRCAACLWLNEQWLRRVPGVLAVEINYASQRAYLRWDVRQQSLSRIVEAIRSIGYDAFPYDPVRDLALEKRDRRRALWRLFVAGFGAMQVMMYAFPAYLDAGAGTLAPESEQLMRWAGMLLTIPVMVFSTGPFFAAAWRDLSVRRISLDTPIAIGIAAGFAASAWATLAGRGEVYFDSIAMLVFLLLGARYVEARARRRAARELDRVVRWMPSFALRIANVDELGAPEHVAANALVPGDLVLVPPGDRVPADGVVLRGESSADESLLSGESYPVAKCAGASLVGGSVNLEQPLVMRVEKSGAGTQAAAIVRLVERAAAGRPKLVDGADRIARALTYVVLAIAAVAFAWWYGVAPARALWVAVAVLVATCPCALALAAPIVLTRANAQLLARGVAFTRAHAIETLDGASDVVLDKTGTLTTGHFSLLHATPLGALGTDASLAMARALEASSRHPIARAFDSSPGTARVSDITSFPGHGIEGVIEGRRVRMGSERFCRELCGTPLVATAGRNTRIYLADARGWLARFELQDQLRTDAAQLVRALASRGLRVHLLSGDVESSVADVSERLGITTFRGEATPQDKFDYVTRLQREGCVVAMIGDGMNDAPVLAAADVSFAMGSGADIAQLQADVVLLGNRLHGIVDAFERARGAMRIVRQNFGWALAYNAIALPLAASGWIGPWEAAIGMTASSFIVVINALRPLGPQGAVHGFAHATRSAKLGLEPLP